LEVILNNATETTTHHILVVEDDRSLAEWVCEYLINHHFIVTLATRGDEAIHLIETDQPDLVVLDIMLPQTNGFDVCKSVRPIYRGPILMLTACSEETDEVLGLEVGADDFLTKPVRPRILLARVMALLRREELRREEPQRNEYLSADNVLQFGTLTINRNSQTTRIDSETVPLSSNEFDMLWFLASNAGSILDRDALVRQLRGIEYDGFDRSIDIGISRLRRKLKDNAQQPYRIKTVRGKGYLFAPDAW
jgi:DNA-binding response OmpR family regulator